jgi:hypothetical protein
MADTTIFGAEFEFDNEESETPDRENRTFQSEEDFQLQKKEWRPRIENREVFRARRG